MEQSVILAFVDGIAIYFRYLQSIIDIPAVWWAVLAILLVMWRFGNSIFYIFTRSK